MKKMFVSLLVVASLALAAIASAPRKQDIVDTAVGAGDFQTLVAAVKAAGLVDALKGKGPFTVFAPTDEAFAKLEKAKPGILADLLKPENKAKLQTILKYHVIPSEVRAASVVKLKNGTMVETLAGKKVKVGNKSGVTIDQAKVIKTDILCTNGVIHVIDTVLIPK